MPSQGASLLARPGAAPAPAQPVLPADLPEIKGFLETSFLDWPGKIAAVLFLPGCDFRCPFCHNFALAATPESFQSFEPQRVLERLRPFVGWIDGVVISGGEPTLHGGLDALCRLLKVEGFGVKLDTNGHRPEVVERLVAARLVDMVAMDVKAPLEPLAYARAVGRPVDLARVRRTIDYLRTSGVAHQFRSTIWPAWHGEAELRAMGEDLRGCQAWTLQAMNPATAWDRAALGEGAPYDAAQLARLQADLADPVCCRGAAGQPV